MKRWTVTLMGVVYYVYGEREEAEQRAFRLLGGPLPKLTQAGRFDLVRNEVRDA